MKKKILIPRGNNILVKPDPEASNVRASGLAVPENVDKERPCFGTVVAVGSLVEDVKRGDRVVYAAFGGDKLHLEEKTPDGDFDHVILNGDIKEGDILAWLK